MRQRGPEKKGKPRVTLLKMRVTPLRRMAKSLLFTKIRQACRNGVVPDDISISTINWDHATGNRYMPGQTLSGDDRDELRNCYNLITSAGKADVRFESPDA